MLSEKNKCRKLLVTCILANDFSSAEYRVGDIIRSAVGDAGDLVSKVYLKLDLDSVQEKTEVVESRATNTGQRVAFFEEKIAFDYRGQDRLKISAYSKRTFTSDPLIGEGALELGHFVRKMEEANDDSATEDECYVTLFRKDVSCGTVLLSCRIAPPPTYMALTSSFQNQIDDCSIISGVDDRKLYVTCLDANYFPTAEFRVGDFIRSTVRDPIDLVSKVYVTLDLDSVQEKTEIVETNESHTGQRDARFNEKFAFDYRGQDCLKVFAHSKRRFVSDPLIGEGILNLDQFARKLDYSWETPQEQECCVALLRKDAPCGTVNLSCRITSATCEALLIELTNFEILAEATAISKKYIDSLLITDCIEST